MTSRTCSLSHYVLKSTLDKIPSGCEQAVFGMGCFWGAERKFWQQKGVVTTSVGYSAGQTKNPTYEQTCTGTTGHAEVVKVVYHPDEISYKELLHVFWSNHNPTQLNRQGADRGSQYRTIILYFNDLQKQQAEKTKEVFQRKLTAKGFDQIVTEIVPGNDHAYYFAEEYHQQYLAKNPGGYCGLKGTGCYTPGEINGLLDF